MCERGGGGGGVLLDRFGEGVRPASQNPYPIYDLFQTNLILSSLVQTDAKGIVKGFSLIGLIDNN